MRIVKVKEIKAAIKIFSFLAFFSLLLALFSIIVAVKGKPHFYWLSAVGIYIFSFLAGFSIGQLTVGLTFIPLALAIGYSFGWIKNKIHSVVFLCLGMMIGLVMVFFVDDAWLFFPFWVFMS